MQMAMRAPSRDMIGNKAVVGGIEYTVSDQGVVNVHDVHIDGFKSLGFHLCKDESPDVPEVTTLSAEEIKLVADARKAKAEAAAKATLGMAEPEKAEAPKPGAAPARK